jgi:transposase
VTPVLRPFVTRAHLSVMSGITPRGQLFTLTRRRPLTSVESIAFLGHVRRMVGHKLLVMCEGSPIHRSNEVKSFLADGGAQFVQLEKLPANAPNLNPDEGVWQHLKHVEMRNLCCRDLYHLSVELNLAVKPLRKKPSVIQSFFAGAGLDI